MATEYSDDEDTGRARLGYAGGSILRVALLFGSVSIALALIVTHLLDSNFSGRGGQWENAFTGIDFNPTASVGSTQRITVRKSVLQPDPTSVCIIRENGTYSGDC